MAMIFLRVKTDDILQSASISHRESAVLRGKRHLRCDECPPRIPSPHLLRFVWCYKKEGLFEADSITLSYLIQTCSEGTSFFLLCNPTCVETSQCGVSTRAESDGVGEWRRIHISKKILFLPHLTIVYEPTLYTYRFPDSDALCGLSHLLRKRKGL